MPERCSCLWRSEDMVLLQLRFQREAAHDTIAKLGQLGCVQFRDLNNRVTAYQRAFTNDVRRCEDSERRLRYFEDLLKKEHTKEVVTESMSEDNEMETLDTLEPALESFETELRELNSKWEQLLQQKNSLREHLEILSQDPNFYRGEGDGEVSGGLSDFTSLGTRQEGLSYITGVIKSDRVPLFERIVFRAARGNMLIRSNLIKDPFEDPLTSEQVEKSVFVIFFSGQRTCEKIKKLCESMQAAIYPYVIGSPQESENSRKLEAFLSDLDRTVTGTKEVRHDILKKINRNFRRWKETVLTEKSIFNVLNMFHFIGPTAVAECWAAKDDLDRIRWALSEAKTASSAQIESLYEELKTEEVHPTYFKTNKFTATHQGIVDSYGIPRYKELNPTCFSVVTFPFLFGVMYGDIGHGFMLLAMAAVFIWKERQLLQANLNEIVAIVFGGRYVLILMALFAIYMGLLYNDFFGMMISPFGHPYWYFPSSVEDARTMCDGGFVVWRGANASLTQGCKLQGGSPYVIGVDSDWAETENKLEFMNGLKMKMAVILGVTQMMWGLVLQLLNHLHFGERNHIWFGWIPEMVFLSCTFGYMCLMILIKWCTDWTSRMSSHILPPSLLETMTNFFLAPGSVLPDRYLYSPDSGQNAFQSLLLLVAVFSVPFMLFPIPIIEYRHHKSAEYGELQERLEQERENKSPTQAPAEGEPQEKEAESTFDMSEVVIKQVIHTIEYVLGCVSNTASYLRLWALSLAHAELSEVFWNYAWIKPLTMDSTGIIVFCGWAVWATFTVGVLGVMESLSAFLHALRLHWVEFQNKFYYGDGVQFIPFDLRDLVPRHPSS